jgi:hypothetical protein
VQAPSDSEPGSGAAAANDRPLANLLGDQAASARQRALDRDGIRAEHLCSGAGSVVTGEVVAPRADCTVSRAATDSSPRTGQNDAVERAGLSPKSRRESHAAACTAPQSIWAEPGQGVTQGDAGCRVRLEPEAALGDTGGVHVSAIGTPEVLARVRRRPAPG